MSESYPRTTLFGIVPHPDEGTVWVFLTCCYLGDVAILDAATGEVIEFHVGAK